jgi:hypothetical protein
MRRDRFLQKAKRTIELVEQVPAEARGKRRARQIVDVADFFQAHAGKSGNDREIDAKRGKRKLCERFALLAGG